MAEILEIEVKDIFLKGKQQKRVKPRSLLCYWAVKKLGFSATELFFLSGRGGMLHFSKKELATGGKISYY